MLEPDELIVTETPREGWAVASGAGRDGGAGPGDHPRAAPGGAGARRRAARAGRPQDLRPGRHRPRRAVVAGGRRARRGPARGRAAPRRGGARGERRRGRADRRPRAAPGGRPRPDASGCGSPGSSAPPGGRRADPGPRATDRAIGVATRVCREHRSRGSGARRGRSPSTEAATRRSVSRHARVASTDHPGRGARRGGSPSTRRRPGDQCHDTRVSRAPITGSGAPTAALVAGSWLRAADAAGGVALAARLDLGELLRAGHVAHVPALGPVELAAVRDHDDGAAPGGTGGRSRCRSGRAPRPGSRRLGRRGVPGTVVAGATAPGAAFAAAAAPGATEPARRRATAPWPGA